MLKSNNQMVSVILLYDKNLYRNKNYDPAALIYINKKRRVIDYHMSYITKYIKKREIVICVGYKSNEVVEYISRKYPNENIRFVENQLHEQTSSSESVRLALNNVNNNNVLLISSATIMNSSNMFIERNQSKIYLLDTTKNNSIGANVGDGGRVEYMCFGAKYAWTGAMWINNKTTVSKLKSTLANYKSKNRLWFEAINDLVENNTKISYEIIKRKI